MAITNTSTGALDNTSDTFELSISDTNTHDLPDTDGDDSAGGGYWDGRTAALVAAYVTNNQDQPLTATLKRTPDPGAIEVDDVASVTVASGETEVLVANIDVPMARFRTVVDFDTAPSGSNDTVVRYDWQRGR
jgi:hypothetical protein